MRSYGSPSQRGGFRGLGARPQTALRPDHGRQAQRTNAREPRRRSLVRHRRHERRRSGAPRPARAGRGVGACAARQLPPPRGLAGLASGRRVRRRERRRRAQQRARLDRADGAGHRAARADGRRRHRRAEHFRGVVVVGVGRARRGRSLRGRRALLGLGERRARLHGAARASTQLGWARRAAPRGLVAAQRAAHPARRRARRSRLDARRRGDDPARP